MLKLIHACVPVALIAAPAIAQAPAAAPAPAQTQTKPNDPNEKVCVKQEVIGSRLGNKKVCMTRAEWADRKLQDQQELTRVQTQRSGPTGN
ncbi:hypothetical protein GCM10023264_14480 [Sphingomonas daechungensis]|uniref:Uncharacterized protein n=1 Tax=Sphingomonas daechungensis TaxID=1176646 RepID=A0ABX6T387_9SPHN|nr:hypothetical protein [Sphingomonas daechungensis]QNP44254.1 hypothetical protein H9L15_07280 [Sphingomonas daechungensis]